jgi:hypothetical protein
MKSVKTDWYGMTEDMKSRTTTTVTKKLELNVLLLAPACRVAASHRRLSVGGQTAGLEISDFYDLRFVLNLLLTKSSLVELLMLQPVESQHLDSYGECIESRCKGRRSGKSLDR